MIALLQRVSSANVTIAGTETARIQQGLLVLIGFQPGDSQTEIDKLLQRVLGYRIFEDINQKMNLSVTDIKGDILIVPQFTLAADTRKGLRPGFSTAASPEDGQQLFSEFIATAKALFANVQQGQFGANMDVSLTNSGPATFWLEYKAP